MCSEYISTKFYIPIVPDRYVVRQRLVEKLKHQVGIRLSLVIAPAGFGKTITVIHSIKAINFSSGHSNSKVAWLSLDEHDNGLVEFVNYFIGAVQQVEKDFAHDLQVSILSGQNPTCSVSEPRALCRGFTAQSQKRSNVLTRCPHPEHPTHFAIHQEYQRV